MEATSALMNHEGIATILATGGNAMVKAAPGTVTTAARDTSGRAYAFSGQAKEMARDYAVRICQSLFASWPGGAKAKEPGWAARRKPQMGLAPPLLPGKAPQPACGRAFNAPGWVAGRLPDQLGSSEASETGANSGGSKMPFCALCTRTYSYLFRSVCGLAQLLCLVFFSTASMKMAATLMPACW